jgi:integrase
MSKPKKRDGGVYPRSDGKILWIRYPDRNGKTQRESSGTADWDEANRRLRERLQARDGNLLEVIRKGEALEFEEWMATFLERYSKPPIRAVKTHEANVRCAKHLRAAFSGQRLVDITADAIEEYLQDRLTQRVRVLAGDGFREKGLVKPTTVHQEFRVLRRVLNVALRKKLLVANPCSGVEFPVTVRGLFRPHYLFWSEQAKVESHGPEYLRNVVRIITETGLRVYKELTPMKKDQLDLPNAVLFIPDSKTPNGTAEVPLTPLAVEAFRRQIARSGDSPFLFPSDLNRYGYQRTFKTVWKKTLRRAKIPYFRLYDLRSTYATRLSAGGVADEWVTQMLRQGDAQVFKKYSQMKLEMKREALERLNRQAGESVVREVGRTCTVMVQ